MSWQDVVLVLASFAAGAQNALAGGGSFLTFPALLFAGLDPRAANITSTIALFPGQVTTGLAGRSLVTGAAGLGFATLFGLSLVGGALGAVLLLVTPPGVFARMVPFLVLFATVVFAWGSFGRRPAGDAGARLGVRGAMFAQFIIAIYGGYFGGGIGILMLAALTAAGVAVRAAGATKNVLAGVMNAAAVVVFLFRAHVAWGLVAYVAIAAIAGGQLGVALLRRINETVLRVGVVLIGIGLTIGLFIDMH
ncbi:sulfite exporter TauE/SafE family protein [Acidiphilium acidophilum]|uniref:Probable membrane transporter protein n=1 Tax=Acidiphilium acidophilum TaxID=76588 RepID=A0AAW9DNI5_ACIAO|nr:sulfite exporter TauE/SafE family protein [Acidiphilium acidophilum]MDX5930626.1 sulfite exporter TauE/SafE family protein [Acidiphilium acidophilum]